MPSCGNCERFVTEQYVRVFAPRGHDTVRVCPNCEDLIRDGGDVREARSTRRGALSKEERKDRRERHRSGPAQSSGTASPSWGDD